MFQSIGERLNKFASVIIRRAKRASGARCTDATEMNLMLATGMLSSIIITTGAAVFSRYEGWSYFDSFYYCFVTLTTIGFGDYVALQNDQALTNKPGYVALSLVFILFGLAVGSYSSSICTSTLGTSWTTSWHCPGLGERATLSGGLIGSLRLDVLARRALRFRISSPCSCKPFSSSCSLFSMFS